MLPQFPCGGARLSLASQCGWGQVHPQAPGAFCLYATGQLHGIWKVEVVGEKKKGDNNNILDQPYSNLKKKKRQGK